MGKAGMKTQNACLLASENGAESRALNTDGSEWAQDAADQKSGWSAALTEQNKVISDSPGRQT